MEYLITFKNTNFAIKAEQALLAQSLPVGVMPLPPQISAGCGICLRLKENDIRQALQVLAAANIDEIGLFSRVSLNGLFVYTPINDRSVLQRNECILKPKEQTK
jgi:hypothetical protein